MVNPIETVCHVKIYEVDIMDTPMIDGPVLIVKTHGIHSDRVVLIHPTGQKITVLASDMHRALNRTSD